MAGGNGSVALFCCADFLCQLEQPWLGPLAGLRRALREPCQPFGSRFSQLANTFGAIRLQISSILQTAWFEALALFVAVNTLIFATLSFFHLLPPIRRTYRRLAARRVPRST